MAKNGVQRSIPEPAISWRYNSHIGSQVGLYVL